MLTQMTETETEARSTWSICIVRDGKEYSVDVDRISVDSYLRSSLLPFRIHDPGFYRTAACLSTISRVDKDAGKLYFRGYDMEELVKHSDFLEVAYLLIYGRGLPTESEGKHWRHQVLTHTYLHEDIRDQLRTFRYDSHPMGMMISTLAALSTFHPEANPSLQGTDLYVQHEHSRDKQIYRILGKVITTAACAYRLRLGRPFNVPDPAESATYTENFLNMLDRLSEPDYISNPRLARLLDKMFIALIDDGLNCATGILRHVASSKVDPYSAIAAAAAATYGSRISGVGDAVLEMLSEIGCVQAVSSFLQNAKASRRRLQGFGHLNYRAYDPRCRVVKNIALELADMIGRDPLLEVALALEDAVLKDPYYTTSRCVFPNVDLYLPLVVRMMGFPPDYFPVLVCIPRTAGWLAHWVEGLADKNARIARPRQVYCGPEEREYVPIGDRVLRTDVAPPRLDIRESKTNMRRKLAVKP